MSTGKKKPREGMVSVACCLKHIAYIKNLNKKKKAKLIYIFIYFQSFLYATVFKHIRMQIYTKQIEASVFSN